MARALFNGEVSESEITMKVKTKAILYSFVSLYTYICRSDIVFAGTMSAPFQF